MHNLTLIGLGGERGGIPPKAIKLKLGHFSQIRISKLLKFKNWKQSVPCCHGNRFERRRSPVKNERIIKCDYGNRFERRRSPVKNERNHKMFSFLNETAISFEIFSEH